MRVFLICGPVSMLLGNAKIINLLSSVTIVHGLSSLSFSFISFKVWNEFSSCSFSYSILLLLMASRNLLFSVWASFSSLLILETTFEPDKYSGQLGNCEGSAFFLLPGVDASNRRQSFHQSKNL